MFNNDWTLHSSSTSITDVWQISHRQRYEEKSISRWMEFVSAGKNQALNECLNKPSI